MSRETHGSGGEGLLRVGLLLWSRVIWRHWRREARLTVFLAGTLALGVAVFLAVRLANKAAVSGFGLFTEAVAGESDLILRPPAGWLPGSVLRELRGATAGNPVSIFPVLELSAVREGETEGAPLKIVGADLVALQNLGGAAAPSLLGGSADGEEVDRVLGAPDRVYLAPALAARWSATAGDEVALVLDDRRVELRVAGVLPEDPNRPAIPDRLLLMDLPGAQRLAGRVEEISRVEFRVPEGGLASHFREEALEAVAGLAEERGWIVETPQDRRSSMTSMSAAFRLNLTILSGLALLVGVYLVMQAMEAAVVKRRREIAILRSLGVSSGQVRAAWLMEGAALGLVGAALGILLGRGLATALVGGVSRTVNTLYYETTTAAVQLEAGEVLFCLLFGLGASLAAVALPAGEAARTTAARGLREGREGGGLALLRNTKLGLLLAVGGILATRIPPVSLPESGTVVPLGGYLGAVLLVVSASILTGLAFRPVAALLALAKGGAMRQYAASQLRRPRGRHRLTAAGLAVAVGMSAAMAILVASFEWTLTSWIGQLLKADVYVAPSGLVTASRQSTISEETRSALAAVPGVAGMDTLRRYQVSMDGREFSLAGSDYHDDPERAFEMMWLDPPESKGTDSLLERVPAPGGIGKSDEAFPAWVSEAFARGFSMGKGDRFAVPTPSGPRELVVVGVFAEYGSEAGSVFLSRHLTSEWFADDSMTDLALYLDPGAGASEMDRLADDLRERFPTLSIRTNARLREESLRIFHQTFAVTYALEFIAVIIAVSGLGLALAGLLLERGDEVRTLRALGASRREIARAGMIEGAGISLAGLLGGLGLSFALGWILIEVINPQSFGWTLRYRVPWGGFALLAALTLLASSLVAWAVGTRGAKLPSDARQGRGTG